MTQMTIDCVRHAQSSVIQTIHCNVGLKCFFSILPNICYYHYILYISLIFSQSHVEMHLWCGGIYNNHIITKCLQSVPVKEFWKSVNNCQWYGQK